MLQALEQVAAVESRHHSFEHLVPGTDIGAARGANIGPWYEVLEAVVAGFDRSDLLERLQQADVPCAPVLDPTEARTPVIAGTDGFVLSRLMQKLVFPGNCVMKIVGREILAERNGGYLLQD